MGAKKIPLRRCTGCGQMKPKTELIRVVRRVDGRFSPDPAGKQAGRGAYVCKSPDCLKRAQKAKGLERSFKAAVPKEVYGSLAEDYE